MWDAAPATVYNQSGLSAANLDFVDMFFEATNLDSLREAFQSITTGIQVKSNETVTNVETSPDFDGWLVFSDPLGKYMEFRGNLSMEFDGASYSRATFDLTNSTIRSSYANILLEHMNYGVTTPVVSAAQVNNLLNTNIAAGNITSIVYYADADRTFLGASNPGDAAARVEVFPMIGTLPNTVMPANQADLMYITFHVVTALRNDTFTEIFTPPVGNTGAQAPTSRSLQVGDQLVRWYIPASLIPLRNVNSTTGIVTGNTEPVRVSFTVGLDVERVQAGVSADFRSTNTASDGSLWFYSNRWHDSEDVTLVFDQPHENNPFYNEGRPGFGDGRGVILKEANRTATVPHVSFDRSFEYNNHRVNLHWMGNNGRLTLLETGQLSLTKGFGIDGQSGQQAPEGLENLVFTVIVPDGDNIVMNFPDDFTWNQAQRRYVLSTAINIDPGTYTVTKTGGEVTDGRYIYLPQPGISRVTVIANQIATFNFINEYFSPLPPDELPGLRIRKIFHGLDEADYPELSFFIQGAFSPDGKVTQPNDHPGWEFCCDTCGYTLTVSKDEALTSMALRNLAVGEYTISEMGWSVDGYELVRATWVVRVASDRYPMFSDEATQVPVITIDLEEDDDVIVRIDNYYEEGEDPEASEPSTAIATPPHPRSRETSPTVAPKTGDERPWLLYVAYIVAGAGLVTGTSLYWYRKKKLPKIVPLQE